MRIASRVPQLLSLSALCACLEAQTVPGTDSSRLSIAAYLGRFSSGTAADIEEAMRTSGYTGDFGGCTGFFCVPTRPGPESYTHANPWLVSVHYALRPHVGLQSVIGGGATGTTSGVSQNETLNVNYGGTVLGELLTVGRPGLRIGAGPALLLGHWDYHSPDDGATERARSTSIGLVGSAATRVRFGSRFFAEATAQYRGFQAARMRSSRPNRPSGKATVSHSYLALGAGFVLR